MDFTRLKKVLAGVSVAAVSLTQAGSVFAAYSDVPSGIWYEDAVQAFLDEGYLDATQPRFRGGETANRAEFVKLVVELNGGILSTPPAVPSFDDVPTGAWYYGYFEEAGKEGWVRGDGNCYGSHPCYARPAANINRAEAAALIVRSFALESSSAAPQFVDNPSGQWYTDVIQTAADHCVLQGDDSTGRVRPSDFMNRAEMVVMLHRVDQGLTYGDDCGDEEIVLEPMITDVVATSSTTVEVEFNVNVDEETAGMADHYTVMNGVEIDVSAVDMISADTVELTLADSMDADADYTLTAEDIMTEDGEEFSDSMSFRGYTAIVQGDGILELSLASGNPVGDTVPRGAVGVVVLSTDLTASCDDDVVIENLTVLHEGFGAVSDIDGVYAAIDGARVSRKRSIDSQDQTAELRFSSPLVVDACETVTVDLVADFSSSATASAEHNFVVELPSDVFSNAKDVEGNFPLRGNTFRVAAVTSGTVTVSYRSVSPNEVEVGDEAVVVGKFEISSDAVEDQTFYSMTLEQNSSASDGDITNLAIRRSDGTVLTNTVAQTVGDFATLVFDPPFTVLEGDKITLEIIADVVGGAGDSVQLHFEEGSDVFAVGSLYGYGKNGQLYGSQVTISSTTSASIIAIDAGEFTIGVSGPVSTDYTRDDNDAVLANVKFKTGGEQIDVKDLFIAVQAATSTGGGLLNNGTSTAYDNVHEVLEDVEIRNKRTGRTIAGVRLTTSGTDFDSTAAKTYQVYRFDDFIVSGEEEWELRVDFVDNGAGNHPKSGDQFKIHVCGEPTDILVNGALTTNSTGCDFGGLLSGGVNTAASRTFQMRVEGLSTGDKVGDVRPRGSISGNFHRIADATLTVAVKDIGTSDTTVENAKNVNFLRFEARAGEAEDILLTSLIFNAQSGSLINAQNYTLWVDTDGNNTVDTILEDGVASQSSQVSFNSLVGGGYVIPAEESVTFEVHADIASNVNTTLTNILQLRFATGATGYIEAEELDDGSSLSGISYNSNCTAGTCDIILTHTASQKWTLLTQGDLYITKDSTPIRNRQLLGGALGESVLRLQLRAENEPVDVYFLALTASGSSATSVDRLEFYKEGETTPFANATIGGCGQRSVPSNSFCASMQNRQLVVPEGADLDVIVRPRMKTDNNGALSNEVIAFYLDHTAVANAGATGSGSVLARGDESSNALSANTGNDAVANGEIFIGLNSAAVNNVIIVGNHNRSVLSKVTSITNANPDANGTAVPTGVSAIGQFKVAAAAHSNSKNGLNDVVLSGVVFNVNATNVALDSDDFKFYNKASTSTKQDCTVFNASGTAIAANHVASGTLLVKCANLISSAVQTEVDQGSDTTFVLEANITNPVVSNTTSTLQVTLQQFDNVAYTVFGTASGQSHIAWKDSDNATCSNAGAAGTSTCGNFTWIEYPETSVKSTSYTS